MKTISLADVKTNYQTFIHDITSGNELAITQEKDTKTIAVIIPYDKWQKTKKRQIGTLQSRGTVIFEKDFQITDEEFVNI